MNTFTVTEKDKELLEAFFSSESFENIGKDGYFTIAATDDEDFIAGVLQFYVDENNEEEATADVTYLYVDEDFRDEGVATLLIDEFKSIVTDSRIEWISASVLKDATKVLKKLFAREGFLMDGACRL